MLEEIIKYAEQFQANLPFTTNISEQEIKTLYQKYESQIIPFGGADLMLIKHKVNLKSSTLMGLKEEFKMFVQEKNSMNSERGQSQDE